MAAAALISASGLAPTAALGPITNGKQVLIPIEPLTIFYDCKPGALIYVKPPRDFFKRVRRVESGSSEGLPTSQMIRVRIRGLKQDRELLTVAPTALALRRGLLARPVPKRILIAVLA
jgi:hypothetical protein